MSTARVRQYSNSPRWFIETGGPLPHPQRVPDWSTCPGTLHTDYGSAEEASAAARWWGYEVEEAL